jgi:hypothetical protein
MSKEYVLKVERNDDILRESYIPFKGKEVLAWQKGQAPKMAFVVVPGYIVSDIRLNEHNVRVVDCEPIPEKEQKALEKIIKRNNFSGHINFNNL